MAYDTVPNLKTALPGPNAEAFITRDDAYISPSYTRGYPFVMERGEGLAAEDVDGNVFLDFTAGIAVNTCGHSHPEIVKTINEASAKFQHMSGTDFFYPSQIDLAEALAKRTSGGVDRRVFFCNSGAEAVECALKLSRWKTRRSWVMSFRGGFHGRTYGAMSLAASKAIHRNHFAPLVPSVVHANYPFPYRAGTHFDSPEAVAQECLDYITETVFKREVQPEEFAAIVVEPIQGEGGYVVPPANWLPGLREICDKHGILLVLDEIQAGMGRTGKFHAHEHFGVKADIVCMAKGIASGLPLGAVVADRDIMEWPGGSHASTFGGNPIACSVALKTMELLDGGLMENATTVGDYLKGKLNEWGAGKDYFGEVRGMGLMLAVDFVKSKDSREKNADLRNAVEQACFRKGLLVLGCGDNNIRLCPSLTVTKEEADTAFAIFTACADECANG